eukprot:2775893-Ditylum_brightwellii.AAC.1
MGIDNTGAMGCKKRLQERCKFIKNISFCFPVRVFTFKGLGSQLDWTVACRMEKGESVSNQKFAGFVTDATTRSTRTCR